jgi:endonuclease/exonuclease/phosphatase family metal-dependent hydrolase
MRVVSWNVAFRAAAAARCHGELLRKLRPDLILLQEVNPGSAEILRLAAGADWLVRGVDLRVPVPGDRPARSRAVAIAGRGKPPTRTWLPAEAPLPERILLAEITVDGTLLTAVSYHAPPGVSWGLIKPRQAIVLAAWLAAQQGPLLLGADANTPLIDAADFAATRTHWHTGDRHLYGEPGDDLLFGPGKIHPLQDALRRWLADHPAESAELADRPLGPLAVTHRTGRRKNSAGTGRRFDSIWITGHWAVQRIDHLYDEGIAAGSDHAVVVADLVLARELNLQRAELRSPLPAPRTQQFERPDSRRMSASWAPPSVTQPAEAFIHGHYCRDCGWRFTASQKRSYCQAPRACRRRQELPLHERDYGCPNNNRVHPEWRDLHS